MGLMSTVLHLEIASGMVKAAQIKDIITHERPCAMCYLAAAAACASLLHTATN
jgi:hypothetical protein